MVWSALKLSLLVVSCSTVLITLLGTAIAFFLATRQFRGKDAVDALLTLPMVLPPTVTGFYLVLLFGRQGLVGRPIYQLTGAAIMFTWQAAVIASTVVALPIMVKSARAAIESVNTELVTASYSLGKSEAETFFRVVLPLASRGMWAGAALSFARAFGEFGATLMLAGNIPGRTQTMPLAIYEAVVSGEDEQATWFALILTVISVSVLYLANRLARKGQQATNA